MPPTFPGKPPNPLGLKIELFRASTSTWVDISLYVLQRNSLQITGFGRPDWTSSMQAATLNLTLKNTDGRFSPKNSAGAYFPDITRNAQLRVSVNAVSKTGVAYSGFRFWGEVSEWPVRWDPSQRDVYDDIVVSGIWRRLSQLQTTLGSAFRRYYANLTGTSTLAGYWPMEDGTGSTQMVPFASPAGTGNATWSVLGSNAPSLAASSNFPGSDAIPQLNAAAMTATIPAGGTTTNNVTRFLLSVPAAGDAAAGTTNWNVAEIDSAGTVAKFELYENASGTLLTQLRNSGGTVIASGTTTHNARGLNLLVSMELTPSGGNVAWALRIIGAGNAGIIESVTGTITTATVGAVTKVVFGRANVLMDTAVGHLAVGYGPVISMVQAATALNGYIGEFAMDRFTRLCAEMGIATETIGTNTTTAAMGPQVDDTLSNVLQMCEDTDAGLLYETKDQFGLGYRALASMANQSVAVTFNYASAILDPSLAPTYDDSLTRNYIQVTNWTGYTQGAVLTAGAMSVLNPPNGIGNGYNYTRAVNAAADSQLPGIANWLLNVGSVDEIRFPVITVKLARITTAALFSSIPSMRIGDYFQVTNPPGHLTTGTLKQLVWGYSETLNAFEWTFAFNAVPETPYETGFSPGTVQLAQLPGGSAVTSQNPGGTGLASLVANGSITPAMLNNGITVHTLGGTAITISASAPATPNTGDIWIASATGLISQWNGSSWVPFKFDASQTIIAATIVTANIAASAITSSLIAAGTVVAGIVDATTVEAAQYIATSAGGEFLAYDGASPATGHLVNAIAGAAGTDSVSNAYPKGLLTQQMALPSQGSAPSAFSGASQLYTSTAGRLRYLSSSGADLVLDRSALNGSNFSMTTSTSPVVMSGALNYLANEASVASEYELEIDGTITTPGTTGIPYTFSLFSDGSIFGTSTSVTFGSVMLVNGQTFAYTLRYRVTVDTTGAGGTSTCVADGGIARIGAGVNYGNVQVGGGMTASPIQRVDTSQAWDTTANHTLALYGNWTGSPASGSAITYQTRITRRN